jgi:protocatechuate 3,4-dioxygenase beta subunit
MARQTTRREFLGRSLAVPAAVVLGTAPHVLAQTGTVRPTPACGDAGDVTAAQMEGPYFTPGSPRRRSLLEPGMPGTRILVEGLVLSTRCRPIAGALLDVWQADDAGDYDNAGYRLRGHQFTDDGGRYSLETIVPGVYPGRTRHIHAKVQAPGQPILTTQLYFPGEPANQRDFIFDPALVVRMEGSTARPVATFTFVLDDQLTRNRARPRRG